MSDAIDACDPGVNACEHCGTLRRMGSGLAEAFDDGTTIVRLWCEKCKSKTWSNPFKRQLLED